MKLFRILLKIAFIISCAYIKFDLLIPAALRLWFSHKSVVENADAASIGIIGGADGPTAVFVSSKAPWLSLHTAAFMAVASFVLLLVTRRKKD